MVFFAVLKGHVEVWERVFCRLHVQSVKSAGRWWRVSKSNPDVWLYGNCFLMELQIFHFLGFGGPLAQSGRKKIGSLGFLNCENRVQIDFVGHSDRVKSIFFSIPQGALVLAQERINQSINQSEVTLESEKCPNDLRNGGCRCFSVWVFFFIKRKRSWKSMRENGSPYREASGQFRLSFFTCQRVASTFAAISIDVTIEYRLLIWKLIRSRTTHSEKHIS